MAAAVGDGRLTVTIGDGGGIALALALLHGGGPQRFGTLAGGLPRVREALHGAHLLPEAALCRALGEGTRG